MAYILGFIYADGAVEDVKKSSRACYISISSNDKVILENIRDAMSSKHNIYFRCPRVCTFRDGNRTYLSSELWTLRIGSMAMYNDLISLGLTPRKSLIIRLPNIPDKFLNFFIRGYFDGDGCVVTYLERRRKSPRIRVIFTCGSRVFLENLKDRLEPILGHSNQAIYSSHHALQLHYSKEKSLILLKFMYKQLSKAPYLERKYKIYQNYLKNLN